MLNICSWWALMSLRVLDMILCARASVLNPQRARGAWAEVPPALLPRRRDVSCSSRKRPRRWRAPLFQTRLSIQLFSPGVQPVIDVGGRPVLPVLQPGRVAARENTWNAYRTMSPCRVDLVLTYDCFTLTVQPDACNRD